jgi:hypothetical protein
MEDLNKILEYYPKLKEALDKDKPKIYNKPTNTQYVKDSKINSNLGSIYDFGGTEGPVEGKNVVIVDYNPDEDTSHVNTTKKYDKDLTIYKLDAKDPNITLPDSLEVNGKLFIAYSNILKFPKFLKVKNLELFSCNMEDNLFDSKLLVEGNLSMVSISYKKNNLIKNLITPEMGDVSKYVEYPGGSHGLPQPVVDKVRDLIEQGGGYVKGKIIIQY